MKYGAFGLVEVLGASNAVLVVDKMLKTAGVSFLTWNAKCGGHVTVFITGDVSAVKAAVDAAPESGCEIINKAVISNPSEEAIRIAESEM
ncbi:MAG: BMC domain-containing protein [Eubacteriales bacterium]|nr:BMC domain-containing protein [Eubacteriales bacterium]